MGCYDSKAELVDLLACFHELKGFGASKCLVEGDSVVVISWGPAKSEGSLQHAHYIPENQGAFAELEDSICHILRSQNKDADRITRCGVI